MQQDMQAAARRFAHRMNDVFIWRKFARFCEAAPVAMQWSGH
jgi:hypothetical protein